VRVVIAGSRPPKDIRLKYRPLDRWYEKNAAVVEAVVKASGFDVTEILQGEAQGFDTLADRWAGWRGIISCPYPAQWKLPNGKIDYGAGKRRNALMAQDGEALIAIWDEESRGTANMIGAMASLDKPVFVWSIKQHAPMTDGVKRAFEISSAKATAA
jgi:YspA, cpYpsA-related SLOG family